MSTMREQRVRRGLDPDQPVVVGPRRGDGVDVGQVDGVWVMPSRPVDLVDQPVGAAVGVVGQRPRDRRAAASAAGRPRPPSRWRRRSRGPRPPATRSAASRTSRVGLSVREYSYSALPGSSWA